MNLKKWGARVANWRKSGPTKPIEWHIGHLHEEVSEVFKALRLNPDPSYKWYGEDGKPEGFGPELADCALAVAFLAEATNTNLEAEMAEKMAYNEGKRAK